MVLSHLQYLSKRKDLLAMTYIPEPPDELIINTPYVHSVGQQVKADAQALLQGSAPDGLVDMQNTLTNEMYMFPMQLYSTMGQFIQIQTQALTQLLQDRIAIGNALMDAATAAEENEIRAVAAFQNTLMDLYGPQTETLP
jgi:hypothetical protein